MSAKKCTKCGLVKDVKFFPKRSPKCNMCNNERNRNAYAENPHATQMSKERVRKWRERQRKNKDE